MILSFHSILLPNIILTDEVSFVFYFYKISND